jgi:hypothetical protein
MVSAKSEIVTPQSFVTSPKMPHTPCSARRCSVSWRLVQNAAAGSTWWGCRPEESASWRARLEVTITVP